MLLLKPQTQPHCSCSQKTPLAQNTWTNRMQGIITHLWHTSILSALLSPSAVDNPTFLFNALLFHFNTPPPSVTSSLKFANHSVARAVPPFWSKVLLVLRQIGLSYPSCKLTKTSPLAISPQLFHSKLKTLLFNKSCPDPSSSPYLPPRLNSKHHPP